MDAMKAREHLSVEVFEDSSEASYQVAQVIIDHIRKTSEQGALPAALPAAMS